MALSIAGAFSKMGASSVFPPGKLVLETSTFMNFLTTGVLLAGFGLFMRISAKEEEKAAEEKEALNEDEKKQAKAKHVRVLNPEGILFRLSCGALFLGIRERFAGPVANLVTALRKGSTVANFPPQGSTIETPMYIQLFAIAVLLWLVSFLLREAEETDKLKNVEGAHTEETKEVGPEVDTEEEEKKEKRCVNLLSVDGVFRRLAIGTAFMALREALAPTLTALLTRMRAAAAVATFPPSGVALEASPFVQLFAVSVLLWLVSFLLREAEETEKKKEESGATEEAKGGREVDKEEKKKNRSVNVLSVDGVFRRLAVGTAFMALREALAPTLTALLTRARAEAAVATFPPSGVALEVPPFVQLLVVSVMLAAFAHLLEDAAQEGAKKEEEGDCVEKEKETKQIEIVTLTGFTRRLSMGVLLLSLRELYLGGAWIGVSADLSAAVTALRRTSNDHVGFPPSGATLETPSAVCLLCLAALSWVFAVMVSSAARDEEETKKKTQKEEADEISKVEKKRPPQQQHTLVSADRIALRVSGCLALVGVRDALQTFSVMLPSVMESLAKPEVAMGGGLLLVGTGLAVFDLRHRSSVMKK